MDRSRDRPRSKQPPSPRPTPSHGLEPTRPATEQAAAVRAGEVTSRELVEESLHAIHDLNDEVNAFVTTVVLKY